MRIAIIGYSGAGKSTLARALAAKYSCEVLHLDTVHWLPGWQEREAAEKEQIVRDFLDTHDSWVIDGNYTKLYHARRMEEADLIIEMLFNRFACYHRVRKRLKQYDGTSRPDMTEGCPEKVDWEFTRWVLHDGRVKKTRQNFKRIRAEHPEKTVVIRSQRALDRFMRAQGVE